MKQKDKNDIHEDSMGCVIILGGGFAGLAYAKR